MERLRHGAVIRTRRFRHRASALGVAVLIAAPVVAPNFTPVALASADGLLTCSLSGRVLFSPALTKAGGGTQSSSVTAHLIGCTTNENITIASGLLSGSFSSSPFTCSSLSTTGAPLAATVTWRAKMNGKRAFISPTAISGDTGTGSFAGSVTTTLSTPANLARGCKSLLGLSAAHLGGTIAFDAGEPITLGCTGFALPSFAPSALPASTGFNAGTVGTSVDVSVANDGSPAQYPTVVPGGPFNTALSHHAAISNDGRYVAFESDATNLVAGDTNGMGDIFVHDRQTGTNERADVNSDGSQVTTSEMAGLGPFGASIWAPAISANGRYVAFTTSATLVPSDTSGPDWIQEQDVYVYDTVTNAIELVSAMPDGTAAGGVMFSPSISADGRYVAFTTEADSTLLPTGTPPSHNPDYIDYRVYVRDRVMGTTNLVFDGDGRGATISADGTTVVFGSSAKACPDPIQLIAVSLATGSVERIDVTTAGAGGIEGDFSEGNFAPAASADGRYVTFMSYAWNLIPGMTDPGPNQSGAFPIGLVRAYVRDRVAGTTTMLNPPLLGSQEQPTISNDGSKVTAGDGFIGTWPNYTAGLGVVNVATGTSTAYGFGGQSGDNHPISGDGRYVAYTHDNWPYGDVYVARIG
jgi:Tol biopolymer transport system component